MKWYDRLVVILIVVISFSITSLWWWTTNRDYRLDVGQEENPLELGWVLIKNDKSDQPIVVDCGSADKFQSRINGKDITVYLETGNKLGSTNRYYFDPVTLKTGDMIEIYSGPFAGQSNISITAEEPTTVLITKVVKNRVFNGIGALIFFAIVARLSVGYYLEKRGLVIEIDYD